MTSAAILRSRPALALAATLPSVVLLARSIADGGHGLWNDFASYWLAGKLVAAGGSPYDLDALKQLGAAEGIAFQAGTGFSYPPPFAVAMVPLGALPFAVAGTVFTIISLTAFGLAAAAWLRDEQLWRATPALAVAVAAAAGLYPPVHNSVFFGQANLLVVAALALGVRAILGGVRRPGFIGGVWIALGGIVKVAPLAVIVPVVLARRTDTAVGMVLGASGAMLAALLLAPSAMEGVSRLTGLGGPDPYWTNQSINGYVSRLTIGSDRVVPAFPGVDPAVAAGLLLVVFGIATLTVLLRARPALGTVAGLSLGIGLTLVAATAGAPKNSFWNHVPALIGVGLLVAAGRPQRFEWALLAAWYGLAVFGVWFDAQGAVLDIGPIGSVLSGGPLIGLLALWAALAGRLLRALPLPSAATLDP